MAGKPQPPKDYIQLGSGRPSKFTAERRASIIKSINKGSPFVLVAEANGIDESTLHAWIATGKMHLKEGIESDYAIFSESIKKAEIDKIESHTDNISDHVDKWQADAWMLERRWYKYYSSSAPIIEMNERLSKLEQGDIKSEKISEQERSQDDDKKV